ncbi:MAG: translocation/assembly module TamB domain-containing protein [Duncaniella sp.]|nr:translocation/assembly module TamB domain-containing protein [Duncaniella sp.]
MLKKLLKIFIITLGCLIALVVLTLVALYLPPVQDFAVKIATEKVSESTGMKISVGRLRLGFPLRLNVKDVCVIEAQGDTMLTARSLSTSVALMPLINGQIDVSGVELDSAFYQMGNADSLMWLRAHIRRADIGATGVGLKSGLINLSNSVIDGADISLRMLNDTTPPAPKDTTSTPYIIKSPLLRLRNVVYRMSMEGTIDSLGCTVEDACLRDALIDLTTSRINARSLAIDSVTAAYLYPAPTDSVVTAASPVDSTDTASVPFTITADTLRLSARSGLYARSGLSPAPGFDPSYISVSAVEIEIDSFYNRGVAIRVPLKRLRAVERSGLDLSGSGLFEMDSVTMKASDFDIRTLYSQLRVDASMGMGDLTADPTIPIALKASGVISPEDVVLAFPDFKAMLQPFSPLSINTDIEGSPERLDIYALNLGMAGIMRLEAEGQVSNVTTPDRLGADLGIKGWLATLTDRQFSFLPLPLLPEMQIRGDVSYQPGQAQGGLSVATRGGRLTADGSWHARSESYDATLQLDRFPVDAFMADLGVGDVTGRFKVDGHGYNPMLASTSIDADAKVIEVEYQKETYRDITLDATLHQGNAKGLLSSLNPNADATVGFDATIDGDSIDWKLDADVRHLDLLALHLSDSVCVGSAHILSQGGMNTKTDAINASLNVESLNWLVGAMSLKPTSPIDLQLTNSQQAAYATLTNGDLRVAFDAPENLFTFIDGLTPAMKEIDAQRDSMRINVQALSAAIPRFSLMADMGTSNLVSSILSESDVALKHTLFTLRNDSLISSNLLVQGITTGSTRIDTINVSALQHGEFLIFRGMMRNRPGTFDDFASANLNGFAGRNRAGLFVVQKNIQGETGFNIGLNATLDTDSIITVNLLPHNPTIAYKPWTLNNDNYLTFDLVTKHLDADVTLEGDNSAIRLYTIHDPAHNDSLGRHIAHHETEPDPLKIEITRLRLQDWLSINPFAPPIKGDLSADLTLHYLDNVLSGNGNVSLDDLYYGKERVGTFDLDLNVSNKGGKTTADIALMVDSVKTITASGVVNDSTLATPFLLDFKMIRFPLAVANPFLPQGTGRLAGTLNGHMDITGTPASPSFSGEISFDSASVKVDMLGTTFRLSDTPVPVDSNVVTMTDFKIFGCNENPLTLNGSVDLKDLANPLIDLSAKASNIQIVKSDRARGGAQVFGRAFIDLDADVRGSLALMRVNTALALLPQTNVTYVMTDAAEALTSQSDADMVTFVQFSDSSAVAKADSLTTTEMALILNADLSLREGAAVNVYLNPSGSNRAQVYPSGDLDFSMTPMTGMRLTGRINLDQGYVRYSPPVISELNFTIAEGSYVVFNGDILNPVLNLHANEIRRANITQEGQNSRLINFDVGLAVTNTLQDMNVQFDLSTNDDITVQNELQSMSPEQRANQAMNLLLYNTYQGGNTKGSAKLGGNPIYSFLTSQLNSWLADNVKGVDISLGMDQYDKTLDGSTSTATSYSYRVSKSLFNDRFKIIVGGNYSTDADADENFSQNLISDISFEYMLNASGSMVIRIFRHTGYESILEGEVTQTGVGFVYKRKLNSLRDLFGVRKRRISSPAPEK